MKKQRKAKTNSPVRDALAQSTLKEHVKDGMGAISSQHHIYFDGTIRESFADSLDLDEATRIGHEQENRWDYLLGHRTSGEIVAVEPHAAKDDEVKTVIKKRSAALRHLQNHLPASAQIADWLWVSASDRIQFANTEKVRRLLDQNGIKFVGKTVQAKHLPPETPTVGAGRKSKS